MVYNVENAHIKTKKLDTEDKEKIGFKSLRLSQFNSKFLQLLQKETV